MNRTDEGGIIIKNRLVLRPPQICQSYHLQLSKEVHQRHPNFTQSLKQARGAVFVKRERLKFLVLLVQGLALLPQVPDRMDSRVSLLVNDSLLQVTVQFELRNR